MAEQIESPRKAGEVEVYETDVDTETDESLIAEKIASEIDQSNTYWGPFKSLCTDLYFDFLAYKESIRDKTKSNTFIPLSYVDIMVSKERVKQIVLGSKPYGQCKSIPYDPDLSFKASQWAYRKLDEAYFEDFIDLLIQDAFIYMGAPFQVTYGTEYKEMPAFWNAESLAEELGIDPSVFAGRPIHIPKFDDDGERIFEVQPTREGIFLENIHVQDFYLPANSVSVESAPWAAKCYRKTLTELESERKPDGTPRYENLDRLRELKTTKRSDTTEKTRQSQPLKKDYPPQSTFVDTFDIIEFCTNKKIFHWPEGADFLIASERNPYKQKPFHIARIEKLTGEPFGFSPNRANHLLSATLNNVVDVVMDSLWLEDNKAWIINSDLVDDFEVGAAQGNLIHVTGLDAGMDVAGAIKAIETRALSTEVLPLWSKLDEVHQLVARRPNMLAGMPVLGAETAYENARLQGGADIGTMGWLSNFITTALRPIHEDLFHLYRLNLVGEDSIDLVDANGQLKQKLAMTPSDVYADYSFEFEFLNKERSKLEERAALTNMLMVWGNMTNVDEVSSLLMENLLLQSGMSDTNRIQQALQKAIGQRRMMEQMAMQMKGGAGGGGPMSALPQGGGEGEVMRDTANMGNVLKPTGM